MFFLYYPDFGLGWRGCDYQGWHPDAAWQGRRAGYQPQGWHDQGPDRGKNKTSRVSQMTTGPGHSYVDP